jgi:phospholipase/carboxylesterase
MATDFTHRFVAGTGSRTLLMLHGTGGNEESLLALGAELLPGANLLSPRGRVLEGTMPRFFRRLAEGVFDQEDLAVRTGELADFLSDAATRYRFDPARVTAVGYSNGANIAASLLLSRPGLLHSALLFRAMVPYETHAVGLEGTRVLILAGRRDPIIPLANAERLATLLREGGAEVTLDIREAGHQLDPGEIEAARRWLSIW